jgi:hypothetical protein
MAWVRGLLGRAKHFAWVARVILHPDVTLMRGKEKKTGELLSICHAGGMERYFRLGFPGQVLREIDQEIDLGRHWLWQIRTLAKTHHCSFLVVESWLNLRNVVSVCLDARNGSYFLPFWVSVTSYIAELNDLLQNNESLNSDIRRIRRERYWFRISTDPKDYGRFLEKYHLPYVTAVHGSFALLSDYSYLCGDDEALHRNWELLQIMVDGDWVAGVILRKSPDTMDVMELGVRNADPRVVKQGALAAVYWFSIQRARELGYSTVCFMLAPPFLRNGVLRMKSKYRPMLKPSPSTQGTVFVPLNKNPITHRILIDHPFIQLQGGELKATGFVPHAGGIEEAREGLSWEIRHFRGITEYEILALDQTL